MTQRAYRHGQRHLSVTVQRAAPGRFTVTVDGRPHDVDAELLDPTTLRLVLGATAHTVHVIRVGDDEHVWFDGGVYVLSPEPVGGVADHPTLAAPVIVAPMPGKVLEVLVQAGARVGAGDGLLVLEAMKMEHRMVAEAAATVRAVHVVSGQMVDAGMVLVELDYGGDG